MVTTWLRFLHVQGRDAEAQRNRIIFPMSAHPPKTSRGSGRFAAVSPGIACRHAVRIETARLDGRIDVTESIFSLAPQILIGNLQRHERLIVLRATRTRLIRRRLAPDDPEMVDPFRRSGYRPVQDDPFRSRDGSKIGNGRGQCHLRRDGISLLAASGTQQNAEHTYEQSQYSTVMPDPGSSPGQALIRHPELLWIMKIKLRFPAFAGITL
jgi:hypothetical protein